MYDEMIWLWDDDHDVIMMLDDLQEITGIRPVTYLRIGHEGMGINGWEYADSIPFDTYLDLYRSKLNCNP